MLLHRTFHFAALLVPTLAGPTLHVEKSIYSRETLEVTEDDVERLALYSEYARAAVCNVDKPDGQLVTCEINCDRVEEDEAVIVGTFFAPQTEVAGYLAVVESRNQIVLVFRPVINDANWSACCNFTTIPTDIVDKGMIHGGFDYAWSEISDDVLASLQEAVQDNPGFRVISIGHSLGGAIATVAAAKLRALDYDVDLYSYGAPRIGNDILSDFITNQITNQEGSIYRVTHNQDPVPLLPLAEGERFGGQYKYRHVSPEYWLTGKPDDPVNWPVDDIKVCEGGLNKTCSAGKPGFNIIQHGQYLGDMVCKNFFPPNFVNGVYLPDRVQKGLASILSGNGDSASLGFEDSAPLGIEECFLPHT